MNGSDGEYFVSFCFLQNFSDYTERLANFSEHTHEFDKYWRTFAAVMLPAVILGACGNLLVLLSISKIVGRKNPFHLVIFSQFIADLLLSGLIYPASLIAVLLNYRAPKAISKLFGLLFLVTQAAVCTSICVVAVERLRGIVFYNRFNKDQHFRMAIFGVLLSWIAPTTVALPILFDAIPGIVMCSEMQKLWRMGNIGVSGAAMELPFTRYLVLFELAFCIIPSFIIVGCYSKLLVFMRTRTRIINVSGISHADASARHNTGMQRILQKRFTTAKMACTIATTFFGTYYPYLTAVALTRQLRNSMPDKTVVLLLNVVTAIFFLGCCVNPLIYALLSGDFRQWFRRVFFPRSMG